MFFDPPPPKKKEKVVLEKYFITLFNYWTKVTMNFINKKRSVTVRDSELCGP